MISLSLLYEAKSLGVAVEELKSEQILTKDSRIIAADTLHTLIHDFSEENEAYYEDVFLRLEDDGRVTLNVYAARKEHEIISDINATKSYGEEEGV